MPFPILLTVLTAMFILLALAAFVPRLPWISASDHHRSIVFALGGLFAAISLLLLASRPRRVEISRESVFIPRGVLGIGFHSRLQREQIAAVELRSPSPADTPAFYEVRLKTHAGVQHTVISMRDLEDALAMVSLLKSEGL